jgi:hypothetical protein
MTDNKKAAGAGVPQAAFKTDSDGDSIPILFRLKAVCYRLAPWLFSLGVA